MEALARACRAGEVPAEVVAVFADRDCGALARARALGIEARVVSPSGFDDRHAWSDELRAQVARHDPHLVVSAGFMRILAPVFVDAFRGRLINLHPSLLPSFPGAHAVRDALEARASETGTTVHFVDHGVDTGEIVVQERVPVEPGDTVDSLHERIKAAEHRLLPRACRLLLERGAAAGEPWGERALMSP
jgi:phosphoribosylglycinamide formyltransferase-1